ncbi:myoneurin-like [Anthonomus grandis grandis]|uniref:myoneurin-like n=1 Tax=Anthonomus grandis grandis TaxID=2921223 RepID=UPI0021657B0B|nr:myoneurin-like [Anthonomus grandis grandis]XP_050299530.1 myoneurin-like [Anthonomus grandis grandis]
MSSPQKRRGRPKKKTQPEPQKLQEQNLKTKCLTRNAKLKQSLDAENNNNITEDLQSKCKRRNDNNFNKNIDVVARIKMDWESDSDDNCDSQTIKNNVDNNEGDIQFTITPFEEEPETSVLVVKPNSISSSNEVNPVNQTMKKKYKPKPKCKKKLEEREAENDFMANNDLAKENNTLNFGRNNIAPKIINNTESKKMEEFLTSKKYKSPSTIVTLTQADMVEKVVRKIPKSEIQQSNRININKTESMKMEELLISKFKREQEKQGADNRFDDLIKEDIFTFEDVKNYDVFEKTTKSLYETYEKVQDENGQNILQCLLCEFATETFKTMALHYKFKHRETPIEEMYFCNYKGCHYRAIHKGMYMWHLRRHSLAADKLVQALFMCDKCRIKFSTRKEYLIHLKHEHKVPQQPEKKPNDFPCATCNYRASKLVYLKSHIYSCHVPSKLKTSYDCNVCGYKTYCKGYLEKHVMSHLKEKNKNTDKVTKRPKRNKVK